MHAKALRRMVEKLGGKLVNESGPKWFCYQCEAPPGMVWNATGDTHCLLVEWLRGCPAEHRAEAILDAMGRVAEGVSPCQDEHCDYCHPEEICP